MPALSFVLPFRLIPVPSSLSKRTHTHGNVFLLSHEFSTSFPVTHLSILATHSFPQRFKPLVQYTFQSPSSLVYPCSRSNESTLTILAPLCLSAQQNLNLHNASARHRSSLVPPFQHLSGKGQYWSSVKKFCSTTYSLCGVRDSETLNVHPNIIGEDEHHHRHAPVRVAFLLSLT